MLGIFDFPLTLTIFYRNPCREILRGNLCNIMQMVLLSATSTRFGPYFAVHYPRAQARGLCTSCDTDSHSMMYAHAHMHAHEGLSARLRMDLNGIVHTSHSIEHTPHIR